MHHMTKHASSFSNTSVFAVQTHHVETAYSNVSTLESVFKKRIVFVNQSTVLVSTEGQNENKKFFKQKRISVDKACNGIVHQKDNSVVIYSPCSLLWKSTAVNWLDTNTFSKYLLLCSTE